MFNLNKTGLSEMRKMISGKFFTCFTLCLLLPVMGATGSIAEYTVGETSLADGKVKLSYNESGAVTELRVSPEGEETVTLTGADIAFADGARIISAQNGRTRIENYFTAGGSLIFGPTNLVYNGAELSRESYTTMFTGVNIDDVSPVSSDSRGVNAMDDKIYHPYYWVRESGVMRVEFQAVAGGGHTKGFLLELKQSGNDIQGKVLAGAYFKGNTNCLGWNMFGAPTINVTDSTWNGKYYYGLKQLTMSPRRETYFYTNGFLKATDYTVVAKGTRVEDIEVLYGASGYRGEMQHLSRMTMMPRHASFANGVYSVQLTQQSGTNPVYDKCVKVELCQMGDDVAAKVVYTKYKSIEANDYTENFDFDRGGAVMNGNVPASGYKDKNGSSGYNIDMLALRRKSRNRIAFAVSGDRELKAVAGQGVEVTFESGASQAKISANGENLMTDSAYVITGGVSHIDFIGKKWSMPIGTVDVWGDASLKSLPGAGFAFDVNFSKGKTVFTMHPGTGVHIGEGWMFNLANHSVVLDSALWHTEKDKMTYINYLTLTNGSSILKENANGRVVAGYWAANPLWRVTGTGVSTCAADINLYAYTKKSETNLPKDLTIEVEDVAAGDEADFIVSGRIYTDSEHPNAAVVKTGAGTMRIDGCIDYVERATQVVEGTLLLNNSDAIAANGSVSLGGGTLAVSAGTVNSFGNVTLTSPSAIKVGDGAKLTMQGLTVLEGATLELTGDVLNNVKASSTLDTDTLSRISVNGRRAYQSVSGYFSRIGLIISFH